MARSGMSWLFFVGVLGHPFTDVRCGHDVERETPPLDNMAGQILENCFFWKTFAVSSPHKTRAGVTVHSHIPACSQTDINTYIKGRSLRSEMPGIQLVRLNAACSVLRNIKFVSQSAGSIGLRGKPFAVARCVAASAKRPSWTEFRGPKDP
ncbi:uncharacterized protein CIMG_13376 [Coccidioides immitis RS]|uniref:Secreted protein n=1 Tax=Coccidioides immitis (strain RS) TaxID=246410 RepID=J3KDX1_COCIM|nr:uncharacterized protein CIMG_13376 [Coccidioides immitis RS]EAS33620.3 hypothetical protein CIMG_13376 [Coccidioides immitis RS]